jgi:putative ABC transport system permease protein
MLLKILKKDLQKKRVISMVLFTFILLAALALSSSSLIMVQLMHSLDQLFESAAIPDFVQMHKGEIDQLAIDNFTAANGYIANQQTIKMLTIDGANLTIGTTVPNEKNSVIDLSFVNQSEEFDFLLGLDNQILSVNPGEIAVPIYYMQTNDVMIGDPVTVRIDKGTEFSFTIAGFLRDAQMNPSLVSSKRFLISDEDYQRLESLVDEYEYLIEFQLENFDRIAEFTNAYQNSGLPNKGPAVDVSIFRMMNLITDGIISLIVMAISLLLTAIALISLRFSILSGLEDDVREIGVMKAIGFAQKDIRNIYLSKYLLLSLLGCGLGYILSLLLSEVLSANMRLYMGAVETSALFYILPLISALVILMIVVGSCMILLRRLKKISAVDAIRTGSTNGNSSRGNKISLIGSPLPVNLFMGFKDVASRTKVFFLLLAVFIACSFLMLLPVNLYNTMNDESFSTYMGVEKSDIRIDLHQTEDILSRYQEIAEYLDNDPTVERYATLVTCRYKFLNAEGHWENINVTTGNLDTFSLAYIKGKAPANGEEIAISFLNADQMGKTIGDTITLEVEGKVVDLKISGIYQDVTNGGKTARAALPIIPETMLWYVVNIELTDSAVPQSKIAEYSMLFSQAKVTDLRDYVLQTFGDTLNLLNAVKWITVFVATFLACLVVSLFLCMLIAKDRTQIAIMKNIGFSAADITLQYVTKTVLVLVVGIIVGMLLCNTLGAVFVSGISRMAGAPNIYFTIRPVEVYLCYPFILIAITAVTTALNCLPIKKNTTTTEMFE